MSEKTVGDVLDENCHKGDDILVCDIGESDEPAVLEKPKPSAMDAPATQENLEQVKEHKRIS